jgi:uncharacterized MAPEG superfamily protein
MNSLSALLLFALWCLLLMLVYVGWRVLEVLRGKRADSWTRGSNPARPPLVVRAEHAHLNCVENLPVFGAIVLVAAVLGRSTAVDVAAPFVLYARVAQSLTHLAGVSHPLVLLRATFFSVQVVLMAWMALRLLNCA